MYTEDYITGTIATTISITLLYDCLLQMIYLLFTCDITPRPSKVAMLLKMIREQVRHVITLELR